MFGSSSRIWGISLVSRPDLARPRAWLFPITAAALFSALVVAMGATTSVTGGWYDRLALPAWAPGDQLYAMGWTLAYGLGAMALLTAWRAMPAGEGEGLLGLFAGAGLLTIGWSHLFFYYHRPDWALYAIGALCLMAVLLIAYCARRSLVAVVMLVPYLGWLSFLALFNMAVVQLNPAFG
ncbi:MAG: tryptophan-rich sensory protein [Sphingomonas sp.]|nr:tryptophan-rich sensory protein [Sphingomonas sp.]